MKSALLHVGVNVSNTEPLLMVLPVFQDWSFIFIPIPSKGDGVSYSDLRDSLPGTCEVIEQLGSPTTMEVHNDPEFVGNTFGEGPRERMLAQLRAGDYIFFCGSMKQIYAPSKQEFLEEPQKYKGQINSLLKSRRGGNWFYGIFAQILIKEVYAGRNVKRRNNLGNDVRELNSGLIEEGNLKTNAHVIRRDNLSNYIIVKGESKNIDRIRVSMVYERVMPISRGNYCLRELQDIFEQHYLERNGDKWFEAILNERGTELLFRNRKVWEM